MSKKITVSSIITSMMILLVIGFVLFFILFKIYQKKSDGNIADSTKITHKNVEITKQSAGSEKSDAQAISETAHVPNTKKGTKISAPHKLPASTVIEKTTINKEQPKPSPQKTTPVRNPGETDKIIRYETVRDDENHPDHALMQHRKEQFGIEKSLDLIVRSDEKVQVGDAVAPIKKIADRLQLNQGKIVEDDLTDTFQMEMKPRLNDSHVNDQADDHNIAFQSSIVDQPEKPAPLETLPQSQSEKPSLIEKNIPAQQSIPIELGKPEPVHKKKPDNRMERLQFVQGYPFIQKKKTDTIKKNIETESLEKPETNRIDSVGDMSPETRLDVYPPTTPKPFEKSTYLGIRVVKPGTNIWDIHFSLLKEYFNFRGVKLSPFADEPRNSGKSSGIGKILKFSEQLVNIYNLESRTFENNLDVIHPMSVIIIYNMTQIFGILDQIDYSVIDRIEFDGESLWIPSVQ
ncbi:MAG: hypothetical protein HQK75_03025 [Candidatus Magnetomorum sp.]|nr:hypothetical protein [Candidatus Magnetomorum sp.]